MYLRSESYGERTAHELLWWSIVIVRSSDENLLLGKRSALWHSRGREPTALCWTMLVGGR